MIEPVILALSSLYCTNGVTFCDTVSGGDLGSQGNMIIPNGRAQNAFQDHSEWPASQGPACWTARASHIHTDNVAVDSYVGGWSRA